MRIKPCFASLCTPCCAHSRAPALLMASQKCPCKHTFLLHGLIYADKALLHGLIYADKALPHGLIYADKTL